MGLECLGFRENSEECRNLFTAKLEVRAESPNSVGRGEMNRGEKNGEGL